MADIMETVAADDGQFTVDDAFLEEVERRVGMGSGEWDIVDPKDLCADVIAVFLNRYKVEKQ